MKPAMKGVTLIRRTLLVMLVVVMGASLVRAANVAGKWRGEFSAPDGSQAHNIFTFVVDGDRKLF